MDEIERIKGQIKALRAKVRDGTATRADRCRLSWLNQELTNLVKRFYRSR